MARAMHMDPSEVYTMVIRTLMIEDSDGDRGEFERGDIDDKEQPWRVRVGDGTVLLSREDTLAIRNWIDSEIGH